MSSFYSPIQFLIARTALCCLVIGKVFFCTKDYVFANASVNISELLWIAVIVIITLLMTNSRYSRTNALALLVLSTIAILLYDLNFLMFMNAMVVVLLLMNFALVEQEQLAWLPVNGITNWKVDNNYLRLIRFNHDFIIITYSLFEIWDGSLLALVLVATVALSYLQSFVKLSWILQSVIFICLILLGQSIFLMLGLCIFQLMLVSSDWFLAKTTDQTFVFFDGHCILCNNWVNLMLREDHSDRLKFGSLQGTTAAEQLPVDLAKGLNSIVVQSGTKIRQRSSAVLYVLQQLGGIWASTKILYIFPSFIRDLIYNFIAHRRYKYFGKLQHCRLPLPEERDRLLD